MAIKPGKCPQTNGTPNCPPFTGKDCIEVFKVYDQCATEELLGSCVRAADHCAAPIPENATIACEVVPNSARCLFIGYGPFNPPFYRPVLVLNEVKVNVTIRSNGTVICPTFTVTLQGITQAQMWAPEGTLVQCQIIAVGPCSCDLTTDPATGDQLICCRVKVCKEIQIKALVKLLVPSYGFCELDPCSGVPQPEFSCPPAQPLYPPERCQETPLVVLQNQDGSAISGVTVSLLRSSSVVTAVTDTSGNASFPDVGGFGGGFDTIQFTDPVTGKSLSFAIPMEFTDQTGALHDCSTVCSILFMRTAEGAATFDVSLDGVLYGTVGA